MQALVYTFIALAATAIGAVAYFGLTFTPAEAILAAVVFGCVCVVLMERTLRQRAENRLEKAIEDLSRLLATDAQAGAVLGQRINAMADINADQRLEGVEADISVLGTVIRQVAEAVADIEDRAKASQSTGRDRMIAAAPPPMMREPEPSIPLELLRQGIDDGRLIYHIQPVVTLPQRRPQGYDLVPRLRMEDGDLADRGDFMPRRGGEDLLRQIEGVGMVEAITISRRARTSGQPITLYVPLSRATLGDSSASEQLIVSLEANRAIAPGLIFAISEHDWQGLTTGERAIADAMVKKGAGFSVTNVRSLRVDVAEMAAQGVRSLRIDASHFIAEPQAFTDFHASDIANYIARFDIKLLATNITNERQIVELLEDGIVLVQGPHIAAPGPVRADLVVESGRAAPQLRRAEY
ncbi:cyclic-di-GMP phosphodiesterase, flagellum assembly factor TipF [Devosia sp. YR412]|uniref:EAL domain-containing protein n=1 Tax=Devosia sp. YR412 TaxID=1881030 RepID=UPI0008C05A0A|nr:EAL domain-containing protein [Devosia sp. YR412]SEP85863.1 cyclic-di-GMP phosphodiesterase, flagellum assembly factor TipF [Devosia sp. YR412]